MKIVLAILNCTGIICILSIRK